MEGSFLQFKGGGRLSMPDNISVRSHSYYTLTLFARFYQTGTEYNVYANDSEFFKIAVTSDGYLTFLTKGATSTTQTSSSTVTDGEWHHYTFIIDISNPPGGLNDKMKMYKDSTPIATDKIGAWPGTVPGLMYIGSSVDQGNIFDLKQIVSHQFYRFTVSDMDYLRNNGDGLLVDDSVFSTLCGGYADSDGYDANISESEGTTTSYNLVVDLSTSSSPSMGSIDGSYISWSSDVTPTNLIEDRNNFADGNSNLSGRRVKAQLQQGKKDGALTLGSSLEL